jgi:hypothetical protein
VRHLIAHALFLRLTFDAPYSKFFTLTLFTVKLMDRFKCWRSPIIAASPVIGWLGFNWLIDGLSLGIVNVRHRHSIARASVHHKGDQVMAETLEGGCLCGRVRFRTNQAPLRTLACHCTFCQRVTGSSYFAESMFPMDAVSFNEGSLSHYVHISQGSNKKVFVHFCPNCGTTVSLTFERWPDIRGISRGCYDDPNAVTVSSHIWIQSAQTGTALPQDVECFSKARMNLEGQAEPSIRHASAVMARPSSDAIMDGRRHG